jgi:hypothetical protein
MEPDLESQLAALYTVFSATEERKRSERLMLFLLEQALKNEPALVYHRMFDHDISPEPAVVKAVAAARCRVSKPY